MATLPLLAPPALALPCAAELSPTSVAAQQDHPEHAPEHGIDLWAMVLPHVVTPYRPLSLLDFVDVPAGMRAPDAIARSARVAQAADRLGYALSLIHI